MGKGFTIDGAIKGTVISMAECLLAPGEINLGWNDISNVLLQDGETVIAFGSGTGKSRTTKACEDALSVYRTTMGTTRKAGRLLFRLTGPENLLLKVVNDTREMIERSLCPTAEVVFGVARDNSLNDEIRIILLTTLEKNRG
jgi:cell division protein FtsZ